MDEFQDLNAVQYEVIRLLAGPRANLFAVGDDDQSIYGFRGASPGIMLGFTRDYPAAKILRLRENYRSQSRITGAAGRVIRENRERFSKNPVSVREAGEKVGLYLLPDPVSQSRYIAGCLARSRARGTPWGEMAVLTRTHAGGGLIAEVLAREGIPFVRKEQAETIYDHWICRDLLSYLALAEGPMKRADLLAVMNRPVRYISREALRAGEPSFEALRAWYAGQGRMLERLEKLWNDLARLGRMKPYAAVNYILHGIGYAGYLKALAGERAAGVGERAGERFRVARLYRGAARRGGRARGEGAAR